MTYHISVNRDALDKGDPLVVLIEHPDGRLQACESAVFEGAWLSAFDPPRPYGARVGVTCEVAYARGDRRWIAT